MRLPFQIRRQPPYNGWLTPLYYPYLVFTHMDNLFSLACPTCPCSHHDSYHLYSRIFLYNPVGPVRSLPARVRQPTSGLSSPQSIMCFSSWKSLLKFVTRIKQMRILKPVAIWFDSSLVAKLSNFLKSLS
jgi:hypothetical protein